MREVNPCDAYVCDLIIVLSWVSAHGCLQLKHQKIEQERLHGGGA